MEEFEGRKVEGIKMLKEEVVAVHFNQRDAI